MLTFVEALSLAGDRRKQNDDALGFARGCAWVIDGATDLDDAPLSGAQSDASWLAHFTSAYLHGAASNKDLRKLIEAASVSAREEFLRLAGPPTQRWKWPIASIVICAERDDQLIGLHLGDCRLLALGADGALHEGGVEASHAKDEEQLARSQTDAQKPLIDRAATIAMLRQLRAAQNQEGASWTFSLDPKCAQHAKMWALKLHRPAHILIASDGFSALADRYGAYDGAGLVQAALDKGLQELGRELRAIESADANGAKHPRFKASDDATALLMRLT
ncbi:MAG: protein phosphatase 2C domain-containing protein [Hyphomonadaceae bacterium]|nr:protein phosphatase 2C domain-containing protein [Hyphomonadaceae bacterium]